MSKRAYLIEAAHFLADFDDILPDEPFITNFW